MSSRFTNYFILNIEHRLGGPIYPDKETENMHFLKS